MVLNKRLSKDDPDSYLIMMMYREAVKHPRDGQWRKFDGTFKYRDITYHMSAIFVLDREMFTYKDLQVERLDKTVRVH